MFVFRQGNIRIINQVLCRTVRPVLLPYHIKGILGWWFVIEFTFCVYYGESAAHPFLGQSLWELNLLSGMLDQRFILQGTGGSLLLLHVNMPPEMETFKCLLQYLLFVMS